MRIQDMTVQEKSVLNKQLDAARSKPGKKLSKEDRKRIADATKSQVENTRKRQAERVKTQVALARKAAKSTDDMVTFDWTTDYSHRCVIANFNFKG